MGMLDGFPFKNREQIKKEQKEFENTIFPFGVEEQRVAANSVLQQIFAGSKMQQEQALFAFITAKHAFLLSETPQEGLQAAHTVLEENKGITREEIELVKSFIILEQGINSIQEYPTYQQVKDDAKGK